MSLKFNIDDLPDHHKQRAMEQISGTGKKPSKHRNVKTIDENGAMVDSKLEAKHIAGFRLQLKSGWIKAYARQVELMLPGGVGMRVDHMIIDNDDEVKFYDSKGRATQDWKNKQKQARECLGIDVQVLT